jgi:diguanylate cyclase (GGDEF)-like protein
MEQAPTFLIVILYLVGLLSTYLAAWAQLRSRVPAAREFFFMLIAIALYAFGYAMELSRIDLTGVLQAINFEYFGLSFIPSLLFLFIYHYTSKKALKRKYLYMVLSIPVITLLMVLTQHFHHMYYINPRMVDGGYFQVLKFDPGIWYYINFTYQQLISLAAIFLLLRFARKCPTKQRREAYIVAIGAALPLVGAILYLIGLIPGGVDPGPFTLAITSIILSIGVFRLGMFELVPAAREFALDSIRDAFLVVDKKQRLQDMNKAARGLPGANKLIIGEELPKNNPFARYLAAIIDGSREELQFSVDDPNGDIKYYQARAYPIETNVPYEKGSAILISDVTDTANLMKMLSHKANTDELTGLLNRRQLIRLGDNEIKRSKQKGTPLGIILIDMDHFNFGHIAGDKVLKQVTQCLSSGLRNADIIGRYGGEEFVIFLPNTDIQLAQTIAERLKDKIINLKIDLENETIEATASFGVHSEVANSLTTIDTLIKTTDKALYLAKNKGRNQVALSTEVGK